MIHKSKVKHQCPKNWSICQLRDRNVRMARLNMTLAKRVYLHSPCKTDAGSNISLAGAKTFCRDKHVCCNKTHLLSWKNMLVLLQQNYVCHDKTLQEIFVATSIRLSQQAYFSCDKHVFVTTKLVFCCDKNMLVATKLLSRHIFVTTNIILSQAYFSCDKHVCHVKTFVTTKMILVVAHASERNSYWKCHHHTKMGLTKHGDQDVFDLKKKKSHTQKQRSTNYNCTRISNSSIWEF